MAQDKADVEAGERIEFSRMDFTGTRASRPLSLE
jgi:hypothetical protein